MNRVKAWLKDYLGLLGLAAAAFIFNTTELIPIGLLSDIASQFQMSEASAGRLISVYSTVVALMSLPLILIFSKVDYKKLFVSIFSLFIVFHVFSGLAPNFGLLMASRVGVALTHALFWAIFIPMATKISPPGKESVGIGMTMTGTAIALIAGVPIGRTIGLHFGWRMTFFTIAAVALAVLILLWIVLPKIESSVKISIREVPKVLKKRSLIVIYLLTFVIITGNYTGYSYIEPFLKQVAGLSDSLITICLGIFGAAGILGSVLFARTFDRNPHRFTVFMVTGLALVLLLGRLAAFNGITMALACLIWGMCFTAYDLVCSADIVKAAPEADTIAMAIYSGIFNAGIACGTSIGGLVSTHIDLWATMLVGGGIALIAVIFYIKKAIKLM